jgi:hypothetical protein
MSFLQSVYRCVSYSFGHVDYLRTDKTCWGWRWREYRCFILHTLLCQSTGNSCPKRKWLWRMTLSKEAWAGVGISLFYHEAGRGRSHARLMEHAPRRLCDYRWGEQVTGCHDLCMKCLSIVL